MLDGRSRPGEMPVPDSDADCGLPGALLAKSRLAVLAPRSVGRNRTATLHDPPGGTVAPEHVSSLGPKLVGSAPPIVTFFTATAVVPGFLSMTV